MKTPPLPVLFSLLVALVPALPVRAAAPEVDLFDGKDLAGWTLVTPQGTDIASVCRVTADGAMAVAGKPIGYLLSDANYSNYRLHVEWRWPANAARNSNSGFLVDLSGGPIDRKTWPLCIQVQTKNGRAGDLLPMAGAVFAEPLSTPSGAPTPQRNRREASSEKPLGEWNSCDIVCQNGTLKCWVNGVLQNEVTGCQPASGRIGVQLEGFPYEMRNIRLQPLD